MSDVEVKRAANRAAFPGVAKIVDEFRAAFGEGVRVDGGAEAGATFGLVLVEPDPTRVFCGSRLATSPNPHPIEVYRQYGMGIKR